MKCVDCPKWDKGEGECTALSTELDDPLCLQRLILWELEFMAGLIESRGEEDEDDSDDGEWWKKSGIIP